ncbi:YjgN family protein [Flavobacterium sp. NG2]|uniref:YjgN family protein n=1 Tax=Flavobacterium sp. NG2 TaxID=3097547 RepID=UPI002A835994|nr:YjgN family protein [Flavobacterium sp. NG2]WPR72198.1 YjgN family protein [Flavobacterium sp. NG2]
MENNLGNNQNYTLDFHGKGSDFFGIVIVNWLLTILTLGIYYPWAKAKQLQFVYSETSLNGDSFSFHGTGKEMFKGFVKAILIFLVLLIVVISIVYIFDIVFLGPLLFYVAIFAILPFAIHGSYRYRMSRTSWRGIRFGYRGDRTEFIKLFFKWIGLTIITLGIYGPWMAMNMRNYLLGNVRFGDAEFEYDGDGGDYFVMNLKGYFLTIFTLGIYMFWWQKELFEYYVNNLSLKKGDDKINFTSTATGGDFFSLVIVNLFILIFTLGLGYAWVAMRTLKFVFEHVELDGDLDLNTIVQTEENYKDATGEDLSDFLDLDAVM